MRKLLILPLLLLLGSCQTESQKTSEIQKPLKQVELITPSNERIQVTLAISPEEQEQGLSGIKSEDFAENQGLFFFYLQENEKHFWMPDTYFDLDIFYLDKNLKIIDIIRKLPFYIGRAQPNLIPRARSVWSRHVLEMKASSEISQKLKIGDVLIWKGKYSLSETEAQVKAKYSH